MPEINDLLAISEGELWVWVDANAQSPSLIQPFKFHLKGCWDCGPCLRLGFPAWDLASF